MDTRKPSKLKNYLFGFNLYNVISFYVIWYACVIGATFGFIKIAVVASFLLTLLHFFLTKKRNQDFIYLVLFFVIGFVVEKIFLFFSILNYPKNTLIWNLDGIPAWIIMLYIGFSTTINHSLLFMTHSSVFSFIFGSVGAAICYYLASLKGIIDFPHNYYSIAIIGLYWGIFMVSIKPINHFFSKRFN